MENEEILEGIFFSLFDDLVKEEINLNQKTKVMENEREFLSLYDFLGKPAGPELGKEVYQIAKFLGEKVTFKDVSNPKYKGKIMCYPRTFLNYIFTLPKVNRHLIK